MVPPPQAVQIEAPMDAVERTAERLGLSPEEMTPAVRAAMVHLQDEVERLQAKLADAELLADLDPLTPVLNRRAFERELGRALASARRYGENLSLVYFDLNGFKAVNDTYGHAGGDAALKHVADVLAAHVRGSDMVGRMGGDEFAVALTHATPENAARRAAQLAALVEAEPVRWRSHAFFLSVAWGVRPAEPGRDALELLAEADAAMYLRKRG
jgi:diguanylate cyclase (GGDEF)-like protein